MIDSEQQEARTVLLIELLKDLERPGLSEAEILSMSERLKYIYLSDSGEFYRHSYSEISYYMYEHHKDNGIPTEANATLIIEHLTAIADLWEAGRADSEENKRLYDAIRKLIDHISLEGVHLSQMADIYYKLAKADTLNQQFENITNEMKSVAEDIQRQGDDIRRQREEASSIGKQIDERKKEVEEIQKEVKNHNTQSITVLSIFSCVVFAFTGGFSMISGSLNVLSGLSPQRSLLLIGILLMLCSVLIDCVYMLLRAARKFSTISQGHLNGFIWCNVISAVIALGFVALYIYYPQIGFPP